MKAQLSERQKNNDKRVSAINIPVNEEEYIIFTKVIREHHRDYFGRYIRGLIVKEYNELREKGLLE